MWGAINVEIVTDSTRFKGACSWRCLVLVPLSQLLWARILLQKRLRQSEQPMQNNINSNRAYRLLAEVSFIDSTCTSGTCGQFHPAEQHWLWLLQCTVASCLAWEILRICTESGCWCFPGQSPWHKSLTTLREAQDAGINSSWICRSGPTRFHREEPNKSWKPLGPQVCRWIGLLLHSSDHCPLLVYLHSIIVWCWQVLCVGFLWATRSSDTNTHTCNDYNYII